MGLHRESTAPAELVFIGWKDNVVTVRTLYQDRKYRRCAAVCSELLESAVHPVYKAFLYFYQAVCHENLGSIAHDYSSNKLPLLEQARDAFILAKETLPLPFCWELGSDFTQNQESPDCATFDMIALYRDSPMTLAEMAPGITLSKRGHRSSIGCPNSKEMVDLLAPVNRTLLFEEHCRRGPVDEDYKHAATCETASNSRAEADHMARLSRSLSSQHALANFLVPSPLFSRGSMSGNEERAIQIKPLVLATLSKPLPPTPINRPLPALPFNHKPQFVLKGRRLVLVPRRKTALATLISKFEKVAPFGTPLSDSKTSHIKSEEPTTSARRFRRISAIFGEKTAGTMKENSDNGCDATDVKNVNRKQSLLDTEPKDIRDVYDTLENSQMRSPKTPCPTSRTTHRDLMVLSAKTASSHNTSLALSLSHESHLELYNEALSSFRTCVQNHIVNISSKIDSAHTKQLAHEDDKRQRFASMYYEQLSSTSSPTRSAIHRGSRISPSKDARLRSFWSIQNVEQKESKNSVSSDNRKMQKQKERIARLKAEGWKSVSKEAKGWKGSIYYENLRATAQRELAAY